MDSSILCFDTLESLSGPPGSNGVKGCGTGSSQLGSMKYCDEWHFLFERSGIMNLLKEKALKLELADCRFRSICWKVFLECLPDSRDDWIPTTRLMRRKYDSLIEKTCRNPRLQQEELDLSYNNPLSQEESSPWNRFFEDSELRIMIKQDVIRTFPEIEFFQTADVQEMMVNVLFHYARQHPHISYRQGMHELLAPIIFVLHNDQQAFLHALELDYVREFSSNLRDNIRELLNPDYTEHDAFFLFSQVMDTVEPWYTWTENYSKVDQFNFMPFSKSNTLGIHNGLGVKLCRINQAMLKTQAPDIYSHLENMEIPLHVFGIRWLRLLFGREFTLPELLILWDAIFADSLSFNLVDYIFVAMLACIRTQLLNADYAKCLSYLMKYPAGRKVTYILRLALHLKDPKRYFEPPRQVMDVQSISNATRVLTRTKSVENYRALPFVRSSNRPTALGLPVQNSRANSEPTTLESGSDTSSEDDGAATTEGSKDKAPTTKVPRRPNQVWSFKGIKKTAITQSLNLLTNGSGDSPPPEKEMVQIKGSNCKNNFPSTSGMDEHGAPTSELSALRKEVCEMRSVMDSCWRQMSTHVSLLQECVLSQSLEREDEIVLAIARLKRVRDTLKGAIEYADSSQEEDEGNTADYMIEDWTIVPCEEPVRAEQEVTQDGDSLSLLSWGSQEKGGSRDGDHRTQEVKKQFLKALVLNQRGGPTSGDVEQASIAAENSS